MKDVDPYPDLLNSQRETAFNAIDNLVEDQIWQRSPYFEHLTIDKAYVMAYESVATILKPKRSIMSTLSVTEARSSLDRLIEETASSHEPIIIKGKRGSAVLISEDDWRSIQETLYLLSINGMQESIREGLATPIEECVSDQHQTPFGISNS